MIKYKGALYVRISAYGKGQNLSWEESSKLDDKALEILSDALSRAKRSIPGLKYKKERRQYTLSTPSIRSLQITPFHSSETGPYASFSYSSKDAKSRKQELETVLGILTTLNLSPKPEKDRCTSYALRLFNPYLVTYSARIFITIPGIAEAEEKMVKDREKPAKFTLTPEERKKLEAASRPVEIRRRINDEGFQNIYFFSLRPFSGADLGRGERYLSIYFDPTQKVYWMFDQTLD